MNWQIIAAVDYDPNAATVYAANHPGTQVYRAAVNYVLAGLPSADVVLAGPPCQPFSQGAAGTGAGDERNGWPELFNYLKKFRPSRRPFMVLAENVPGMLSRENIGYFHSLRKEFANLGYVIEAKELPAVRYGSPSERNRVFIWAVRAGEELPRFPAFTHGSTGPLDNSPHLLPLVTVSEALADLPNTEPERIYGWSPAMRAKHPPAEDSKQCPTIMAKWYKGGAEGLRKISDVRVCRLSTRQCARLMGCPDDMRWGGVAKSHQYRVIGNGWSLHVAHALSVAAKVQYLHRDIFTVVDLFCGGGLGSLGWMGKVWRRPGDAERMLRPVVFAPGEDQDACAVCGLDYCDCLCPGPTQDGIEYETINNVLYGYPAL